MTRRGAGWLAPAALAPAALAAALAAALGGCATNRTSASRRPLPCPFETCGGDAASLARLTAEQLGEPAQAVQVAAVQPQFAGAVLVWRAHASGKVYDCREGRDPRTGAVHYVDCPTVQRQGRPQRLPMTASTA